jgi:hypothetical protein
LKPLITSAFDLPDHLSPKADPSLIAADEQQFAAIAQTLDDSLADLSGRLDAEGRRRAASARRRWTATWKSTAYQLACARCAASAWTSASAAWS